MTQEEKKLIMEFNALCYLTGEDAKTKVLELMDEYLDTFRDPETGVFNPQPALIPKFYCPYAEEEDEVECEFYECCPHSGRLTNDNPDEKVKTYALYEANIGDTPYTAVLDEFGSVLIPSNLVELLDESVI